MVTDQRLVLLLLVFLRAHYLVPCFSASMFFLLDNCSDHSNLTTIFILTIRRFISTLIRVKMWTVPISHTVFLRLSCGCLKMYCVWSSKIELYTHKLRNAGSIALSVDGVALELQLKKKNLGIIFDPSLSFEPFMLNTVKTSFYHLRNIARLRPMLSFSVAERLINYFVFSRLDYCNALLNEVSKSCINKLQYLQNSAARILSGARVVDHITLVLESLHWLPVRFRIVLMTYKALHGLAFTQNLLRMVF